MTPESLTKMETKRPEWTPWIHARSAAAIVSNMRILISATILLPSEPSATVDTQLARARMATATTIRLGST